MLMLTLYALNTLLLAQTSEEPPSAPSAGPFAQHQVRVAIQGGTAGAFGERYFILGAGAAYYVLDGLEVGVDVESWFGSPNITKLSPQVRYILHFVPGIKPYIGTFYRHFFISGFEDIDSVGGRAGVYYIAGRQAFIGFGVIHEVFLSCPASSNVCSNTYPEITLSFTF